MTGPAGFERTLTDWLDDAGAQDIPPRVIDAAIDRSRHTPRARPLPNFLTRWLPMTTNFAAAPPLPLVRPRPLARLGPLGTLIALALLAVALVGAALLAVGSPAPTGVVHNGRIAFDAQGDIWLVDGDGTDLLRLTDTPARETSPVWSPDGARLAVWSTDGVAPTIAILHPDGTLETSVGAPEGLTFQTPDSGSCNAMARWSPDGTTLAATAITSSRVPAVAIIDAATGTGHALEVGMPVCGFAWSPVGSTLLLTGGADDNESLYLSEPDGSGLRRVSSAGRIIGVASDSASAFTPDGKAIAAEWYEAAGAAPDVVMVELDGTERTLVGGPMPDAGTSVSPDGSLVSYLEAPPGGQGVGHASHALFVVGSDGATAPQLVSDSVLRLHRDLVTG